MVEHGSGYPYDGTPDFQLPARGTVPPAIVESDYFIAKYGYLSTSNLQFYNDDRLNPYAFEDGEEFRWIRPGAFGGKSLIRSEESRVGKEGGSTCRYRWSTFH